MSSHDSSVATGPRRPSRRFGLTLLLALALVAAGCGQKGPLKLPQPKPATPATPASAPSS